MKQFILMVDASGLGAGSVLMQSDSEEVEHHPVCYFHTSLTHIKEIIQQLNKRPLP